MKESPAYCDQHHSSLRGQVVLRKTRKLAKLEPERDPAPITLHSLSFKSLLEFLP